MPSKVFTYFHDPAGVYSHPMLDAWRTNWRRAGWTPVVLTPGYASVNPRYQQVSPVFATYPTVNGKHYEMACFLRWLAVQQAAREEGGPVLAVDWDVGCVSYTPEMLHEDASSLRCTLLDAHAVPCAVVGTSAGFDRFIDVFLNPEYTKPEMQAGRPHVSDMTCIIAAQGQFLRALRCNRHDYDNKLPLVHVASDSIPAAARPHKHLEFTRILAERTAAHLRRKRQPSD